MLKTDLKNIRIDDLLRNRKLSVRAYHTCKHNELFTLHEIIEFFEEYGTFLNTRNCGKGTELELQQLCLEKISLIEDYIEPLFVDDPIIDDPIMVEINNRRILFDSLSISQKEIINIIYDSKKEALDVRSANALSKISSNDFLYDVLCFPNFDLKVLPNVGVKSVTVLKEFKREIENTVQMVSELSSVETTQILTPLKFGIHSTDPFLNAFIEKENHLPMFWIIQKIIEQSDDRNISIVVDSVGLFKNIDIKPLELIAKEQGLSKERVRQIRNRTFNNYFSNSSFFLKDSFDWEHYFQKLITYDILTINNSFISSICHTENTNLSVKTILHILSIAFKERYQLFGGIENTREVESEWKTTFLIKTQLCSIFNFESFRKYFCDLMTSIRTEDQLFNIDEYLNTTCLCWITPSFDQLETLVHVLNEILINEFQVYSDLNGGALLKANKGKRASDVVYEILEEKGQAMKLKEIFVEFKKRVPNHKYIEPQQLRASIQHNENIIAIQRKSTYALITNVSTSTIRSAIIDFLSENDLPQSDEIITEYVLRFFPTSNLASIRATMSNDTLKRFSTFKNGLFGLSSKVYPIDFEIVDDATGSRKSFENRLRDFEKFLINNERYPFSISSDENEVTLYRWWNIVTSGRKQLDKNQFREIERIKKEYSDLILTKKDLEWYMKLHELRTFIIENRKLPSYNGSERFLFGWWKRFESNFLENSLNEEKRKIYFELCKLL